MTARVILPDGYQPVSLAVGQRPEQDAADGAEHRRGQPHAERERRDHRPGEGGLGAQQSEVVAQILEHEAHDVVSWAGMRPLAGRAAAPRASCQQLTGL